MEKKTALELMNEMDDQTFEECLKKLPSRLPAPTLEEIQYLIDSVPENEKETTKKIVEKAVELGWKSLGFWTYDWEPDLSDLVGVNPETGLVGFLKSELKE